MDEIAPEYDVVVLGTGKLLPHHPMEFLADRFPRVDRMCALWVRNPKLLAHSSDMLIGRI